MINCYSGDMTVIESILKDLETLPASKLVKRRDERMTALKATAGCLTEDEGEAFEKAVCR